MTIKLAAIIPAGGNREGRIVRALASVLPLVDHVFLVDTGRSAQKAIALVLSTLNPAIVTVVDATGKDDAFCCSEARNDGLLAASEMLPDGSWVVVVDTDEALEPNGFDIRSYLASTKANVIQVFSSKRDSRYSKERFIKLPAPGKYVSGGGPDVDLHEEFLGDGIRREAMPVVTFTEDEKSPAEFEESMALTEKKCRLWLERDPEAQRPRFYLGNTLQYFGEQKRSVEILSEAIHHYRFYIGATKFDHEFSWASYRASQCCHNIAVFSGDKAWHERALEFLGPAMSRDPHAYELFTMAASQEAALGHADKAEAWTAIAIGAGETTTMPRLPHHRFGFQYPPAAHEEPWNIRQSVFESVVEHARREGVPRDKLRVYEAEAQRCKGIAALARSERMAAR